MNNILLLIYLISLGFVGALANYLTAYVKGHISCDVISYLVGEFKRTLGSFGTIVIAALGVMQSGDVDLNSPGVFATMFAAGYTIDSLINKAPEFKC